MAKLVVLIAGNICAGKTNLVRYIEGIQKEKKIFGSFLEAGEELSTITEFIDPEALKLFYRDRSHGYNFEKSCLDGRITRYFKAKRGSGLYIFDRGMIEGAETFCKNSWQEGYVTHDEYKIYLKDLKKGLDDLNRVKQKKWLERLIVYLQVKDTRILKKRNPNRNTPGEKISGKYLQKINSRYEEFFQKINPIYLSYGVQPPEVLTIDASVDFNLNPNFLPATLERIISKIKEIKETK